MGGAEWIFLRLSAADLQPRLRPRRQQRHQRQLLRPRLQRRAQLQLLAQDAHAQVCADTEASSHTAVETIAVFAKANIVAIDDRLMRSVLIDFAPLRVPAAASRAQSGKSQNSIDTLVPIQVKGRSTVAS